ncbi:MAG: DegT/DnrJ/EryC1/StrS aminotransferase family protein, partial [Chloroflexi bacterium]|nr:DegT/DnrJ/EryC1/StrS aminotransferase family protein [Chloroflexota bacterium]
MQVPMTDLVIQYENLKEEIDGAVHGVMSSGGFIMGPEVARFEEEMAAFCQAPYAIGVGSGTEALHLALRACGIGPGDE